MTNAPDLYAEDGVDIYLHVNGHCFHQNASQHWSRMHPASVPAHLTWLPLSPADRQDWVATLEANKLLR